MGLNVGCHDCGSPPANARLGRWLTSSSLRVATAFVGTADSDREVLVAFFALKWGDRWYNSTAWAAADAPLDEWFGVTTDADGRVIRLEVSGTGLSGPIPPILAKLTKLERLDLSGGPLRGADSDGPNCAGSLRGEIPSELGELTNLRELDLSCNELVGPIPSALGRLVKLENAQAGPEPVERVDPDRAPQAAQPPAARPLVQQAGRAAACRAGATDEADLRSLLLERQHAGPGRFLPKRGRDGFEASRYLFGSTTTMLSGPAAIDRVGDGLPGLHTLNF